MDIELTTTELNELAIKAKKDSTNYINVYLDLTYGKEIDLSTILDSLVEFGAKTLADVKDVQLVFNSEDEDVEITGEIKVSSEDKFKELKKQALEKKQERYKKYLEAQKEFG